MTPRNVEAAGPPKDVRAVLRDGIAVHGGGMVLRGVSAADRPTAATAVVASRRIGGAVARNRAKRRLREALRQASLPPGIEVVAVARSATLTMPMPELCAEAASLVHRLLDKLSGQRGGA